MKAGAAGALLFVAIYFGGIAAADPNFNFGPVIVAGAACGLFVALVMSKGEAS